MANEFIIKNGFISQGNSTVTNDLNISGNVGIGTSSPSTKLEIKGSTIGVGTNIFKLTPVSGTSSTVYNDSGQIVIKSDSQEQQLVVGSSTVAGYYGGVDIQGQSISLLKFTLAGSEIGRTWHAASDFNIRHSGTLQLRRHSDNYIYTNVDSTNGNWLFQIPTGAPTTPYSNVKIGVIGDNSNSTAYGLKVQNSGGTDNFVVRNDGNVGIGTSSPSEKLEVSGKTKTVNLQITSGATNGYVLSSDSLGNATWIPGSSISGVIPTFLELNDTDKTVWNNGHNNQSYNTSFGELALRVNTSGNYNTAIGYGVLKNNTTSSNNTGVGNASLQANTGSENTAIGYNALFSNTTGGYNVAVGSGALYTTSGSSMVAIGYQSLNLNTTGANNTAIGHTALRNNLTGGALTALGVSALYANTTGDINTAIGSYALNANTTGANNTAVGGNAGVSNISGDQNSAFGFNALSTITTGSSNTAIGCNSLAYATNCDNNIAIGLSSLITNKGSDNIGIGVNTSSGNFNGSIILGKYATATASNQFVVGSSSVNAGSVVSEINTSSKVWNVIINGVAIKILLA